MGWGFGKGKGNGNGKGDGDVGFLVWDLGFGIWEGVDDYRCFCCGFMKMRYLR